MKEIFCFLAIFILAFALIGCTTTEQNQTSEANATEEQQEANTSYTYTLDTTSNIYFTWGDSGGEVIEPEYYRDVWIFIDKDIHSRAKFNKNICYGEENDLHMGDAFISYGQYFYGGFITHIGWHFAGYGETYGDYEEIVENKDGTLIRIEVPMIDSDSNKIEFCVVYWSAYCDYFAVQGDITLPINYKNSKDNPMILDRELIEKMELYHSPIVDCSDQDGWYTVSGCEVLDKVTDLKIVDWRD
jgi:hypothetical protein